VTGSTRILRHLVAAILPVVAACASSPVAPDARLGEARALIEALAHDGGCDRAALTEARGAVEFAQYEAGRDGSQILAQQRADVAYEKAVAAQASCGRVSSRR
jgi:hypothetical protein